MTFLRPSVGFYSPIAFSPIIAVRNDFRFLNVDDVLRYAIRLALTSFENFPPIKVDLAIFEAKRSTAIELLNREFSIRRKKISDLLILGVSGKMAVSDDVDGADVDVIFRNIDYLYSLKKIVREAISPMLFINDYALCGEKLFLDLPNSYIVINDGEDLQSLVVRAVEKRKMFQRIANEQKDLSVSRDDFRWGANPFLVPIRHLYRDRINEMVALHSCVFGEFDLSMQLLMHLAAYRVDEVWSIPESLPSSQSIGLETCVEFERMVNDGVIVPNDDLILTEITRLASELDAYFSGLHADVCGVSISLPSSRMCNPDFSPFADAGVHTEITLANKEFVDGLNGPIMIAHEKISRKKVIFSPVSPDISALYSRGFCNLHYANPGEIAVFGAFVEGEELPFAYSSYSKISYAYTKEMLYYMGFADGEIIESSRAWNAAWAPENTMSVLFSYSQERLKEIFGDKLRGILTSINPNLGFSASAFRGIHFEVASLKPTIFSYQIEDGKPYFRHKGEIARALGVEASALSASHYYTENKIPFLPTVELLYLYDKNERKKLSESPIYVVSENDYLSNR